MWIWARTVSMWVFAAVGASLCTSPSETEREGGGERGGLYLTVRECRSSTSHSFYPSVLEEQGGTSPQFPLSADSRITTPRLENGFSAADVHPVQSECLQRSVRRHSPWVFPLLISPVSFSPGCECRSCRRSWCVDADGGCSAPRRLPPSPGWLQQEASWLIWSCAAVAHLNFTWRCLWVGSFVSVWCRWTSFLSVRDEGQANRFMSFHSQVRRSLERAQLLLQLRACLAPSSHVFWGFLGVCFADVCCWTQTADWSQLYCTDAWCYYWSTPTWKSTQAEDRLLFPHRLFIGNLKLCSFVFDCMSGSNNVRVHQSFIFSHLSGRNSVKAPLSDCWMWKLLVYK